MKKKFLLLVMCVCLFSTMNAEPVSHLPSIHVQGQASLFKPSNELQIQLSVVTSEKTAQEAVSANQVKMNKMLSALRELGLEENEIQTQRFSINPLYSQAPRNPPENWRAEINGYEVRNSLLVKTGKMDHAGKIIDVAVQNGVDQIDSLSFGLRDAQEFRQEAIAAAVAKGISEANFVAAAANVQLGRIINIDVTLHEPPHYPQRFALMKAAPIMETQIVPGSVETQASVSMTFEIRQN